MVEAVHEGLNVLAKLLEIVGAIILVVGFVVGTVRWLRESFQEKIADAGERYRRALGRVILIGLELLVAATIIKTITVKPTVEGMGLLVFMVAIRTTIGWTTFLEMNGRWPWINPRSGAEKSGTES
jgi:uncharacterized membrane protein